jgi:hypothetical protein
VRRQAAAGVDPAVGGAVPGVGAAPVEGQRTS